MADQICIYEVTLTSYIEQGMNTTQIVDLIFDLHGEFINPKVIARRQVTRLIDRLITRVAPDLILNRKHEDKENMTLNAAQATPAKPGANLLVEPERKPENTTKERKNLALQLNQARQDPNPAPSAAQAAVASPLLEQAPESERSDAFSIPNSDGDSSARQ